MPLRSGAEYQNVFPLGMNAEADAVMAAEIAENAADNAMLAAPVGAALEEGGSGSLAIDIPNNPLVPFPANAAVAGPSVPGSVHEHLYPGAAPLDRLGNRVNLPKDAIKLSKFTQGKTGQILQLVIPYYKL
jgi:hypothetical protein